MSNGNKYRLEFEPNQYRYILYNGNSPVVDFNYGEIGKDRQAAYDSVEKLEKVEGGSVERILVTHMNIDVGELQGYVDADVEKV